jgi:EpsI family protein
MQTTLRHKLTLGLTVVAFALCYATVAVGLIDKWSTNYVYSYGFAVPLIAAYIVWTRWPRIRPLTLEPDHVAGMLLTSAGVFALVAGRVGALLAVEQISILFTLSGLVLFFLGRSALRALAFPIIYLLLCIPIWDYPIALFQEPSQTLSARIALSMLHPIGVPAFREGTRLVLPSVTLEVLRECSGVNQLVAIVAMTLPAAFLWLESYGRRAALLVIAIATAYFSNGVRIALIGVLAYNNVKGAHSQGALHILQGLAVSSLGYFLIGGCLSILAKTEKARISSGDRSGATSAEPHRDVQRFPWPAAVVIGVLFLAAGYTAFFRPVTVRLQQDLAALPVAIGDWTADYTTPARFTVGGVDDELSRVYRNSAGERIELYVGYHRYQVEGKEFGSEANHAARSAASSSLRADPNAAADTHRENVETEMWFDVNGRVLPNVYLARAVTIWDAITARRTNAAVVIVRWNRGTDRQRADSDAGEKQFIRELVPVLRDYLPSFDRSAQMNGRQAAARRLSLRIHPTERLSSTPPRLSNAISPVTTSTLGSGRG